MGRVGWSVCAFVFAALLVVAIAPALAGQDAAPKKAAVEVSADNASCVDCHRKTSPALVAQWEDSRHAVEGVGCRECHEGKEGEPDVWKHEGVFVSALVTPLDCSNCHSREYEEFSRSHHARAGEIMASLDNVLAEKAAGMPNNIADAVNGCWQCHGSIVKLKRDENGKPVQVGKEGRVAIDSDTWPNSGIGRLNPDGSKGSCHACHSRHSFSASLARSPENCGKCHMGPDHPQIEIYNESKHGIAFYANRDDMALKKEGDWVLGKDYSQAPTCATCHIGSYMTPGGVAAGNSHDVGERISWTLRPVVSTKLNLVVFEDGTKEDYPDNKPIPKIGATVDTTDKVVENEKMVSKTVKRRVKNVVMWDQRRDEMKAVCRNCHNDAFVGNFYQQYDDLVTLYNDKFGKPAQAIMNDLLADGILKKEAPFEKEVQWVFYELWHHEGRRARHGASMMGPDYTHWHGMYEVSKHFYEKFLPAVIQAAAEHSPAMKDKWTKRVDELLQQPEHKWKNGMTPEEAEAMKKMYESRYGKTGM